MNSSHRNIKLIRIMVIVIITITIWFTLLPISSIEAAENDVLVSGETWLQGQGVDVYSNNGDYNGTWQCPEVARRLYGKMGWPSVRCGGNSGAAYIPEGSPELICYTPGLGYVPMPGDLIIENPTSSNPYGHIAIVDYVAGNIIYAVEQNGSLSTLGRKEYTYNNSYYEGGYGSVRAIMHAPQNQFTNPKLEELISKPELPVNNKSVDLSKASASNLRLAVLLPKEDEKVVTANDSHPSQFSFIMNSKEKFIQLNNR